ncbi:MAG: hypothetical protein LC798_12920 [Chloroflexi bacterium]|nr:hypothetical protein [Chloroflexota bacterium]
MVGTAQPSDFQRLRVVGVVTMHIVRGPTLLAWQPLDNTAADRTVESEPGGEPLRVPPPCELHLAAQLDGILLPPATLPRYYAILM